MSQRAVLAAVTVMVSSGPAQWLEATIPMPGGRPPWAVCCNTEAGKVYVAANQYYPGLDSTVTIIDAASNEVIRTFTVGNRPEALCYAAGWNKVYCAVQDEATVVAIDGAGDSIIARVDVGPTPQSLCYDPAGGRVYCASQNGGVTVIDCAADTVLAHVDLDPWPYAVCYHPANNHVYVGRFIGRLDVIDCATNQWVAGLTVDSFPEFLAGDSSANKVYVACVDARDVTVIDGAADTVCAEVRLPGGASGLCANPAEGKVYCASYQNRVTVVDCATDSVVATVTVGSGPGAMCYNPLNNRVYVACYGPNSVSVIHGNRNTVVATVGVGTYPRAFAWFPDSNRTYVACLNGACVSVLRDDMSGIAGPVDGSPPSRVSRAVVCHGSLRLEGPGRATLLDGTGRKVADLEPGDNDLRRLAPGVYFAVEQEDGRVAKVVMAR